jgi:long-chain acyl-CoA synthetase
MAQLPDGISAIAAADPKRPAFILDGKVTTYAEFDERTSRLAHALKARGVAVNDRVAIMLPNSIEFFEAWTATGKAGASAVLVNWHLKADELSWILEDSQARLLVTTDALMVHARDALVRNPGCDVLVTGLDYEGAIAAVADDAEPLAISGLAPPVFYTSGTTGRPKGVVHGGTFDAERSEMMMRGQVALWSWTSDDVYILSGPAYHAGPGGFAMAALFVGAPTVILREWDPREWLRLVAEHHVTISFVVPSHFIRLLEVPEAERPRSGLESLRILVHAGAPCPVTVKRRAIEALAPAGIWELYGMSEGGATRISPEEWLARPGSVGLPWPGTEVRILDETGKELPAGEAGLIYVRPAGGAAFHYHDDPDKTTSAWLDGAFTVGDVGKLDEDGYLYLTDRAVDMVIRGGVNIYPREIEEVLHRHPAVVDCAVFGIPNDRLGEELHAVVELRSPATAEELDAWCRELLADYKVPRSFEFVDELPRQPNGKVLKRRLREPYWAGHETAIN